MLLSRLRLLLRRLRRRRLRFSTRARGARSTRKESNGNVPYNGHIIGNNREWYHGDSFGSGDSIGWRWLLIGVPGRLFSRIFGGGDGGDASSPSMYKPKHHGRFDYRRRRRISMPVLILSTILFTVCFILLALLAVYKQPYWLICVLQYCYPDVLWHIPLPAVSVDFSSSPNSVLGNDNKIVALTVDDAPTRYSLEIADILRDNDAHATFFVIGAQAQLRGGLPILTRLVEQGHELGNHAMRDEAAVGLKDETLVEQIQRVDEMLVKAYAEAKIEPKVKPKADPRTANTDIGGKLREREVQVGSEPEPEPEPIPPASRIVSAPAPVPATPDILSPSSTSKRNQKSKSKAKPLPANHHPDHPKHPLQKRDNQAQPQKNPSQANQLQTPRLFRPGSALFTSRMRRTLSRLNYTLVLGSIYPFDAQLSDYKRNAAHILDRVRPGAIIVCHDRRSWTPLMLRILMPELKRRGWRVGSVGEVLEWRKGVTSQGGGDDDDGGPAR